MIGEYADKIMIAQAEAPGNLPSIQGKIVTFPTDSSETCLLFNGKIMTVPTKAPGNLPTIQWQDNGSSDRSTRKPAYYSRQDNDFSNRSTNNLAYYLMAR